MFYIETEFYKRKAGILEYTLIFLIISVILYAIIFLAYRDSAAYYLSMLEKTKEQERELLLLDAKQAEIHDSIKEMQHEILDN